MVFCVGRICIDFRATDELKACFARQLDHIILAHIAVPREGVLRFISPATVFFNAQNAAGLENKIEIAKRFFCPVLCHPIVNISKCQDAIDAIGQPQWARAGAKRHHADIAVIGRI